MAAVTNGLRDLDLVKFLYINRQEDYDDTMDRAKTYMLANEALHSSGDEVRMPFLKQEKNFEKGKVW